MDTKTTGIGEKKHYELEVEWYVSRPFVRKEGEFKKIERPQVSLILPQHFGQERLRLVNMTPQTALNLLAWLRQEEDELKRLAQT